jgi:hypothetical protein
MVVPMPGVMLDNFGMQRTPITRSFLRWRRRGAADAER